MRSLNGEGPVGIELAGSSGKGENATEGGSGAAWGVMSNTTELKVKSDSANGTFWTMDKPPGPPIALVVAEGEPNSGLGPTPLVVTLPLKSKSPVVTKSTLPTASLIAMPFDAINDPGERR